MTGTGALDFAVFGSPTEDRQIERVTFSHPSESRSCTGSYDSQVRPRSSPSRRPENAAVLDAALFGDGCTEALARERFGGTVYISFGHDWRRDGRGRLEARRAKLPHERQYEALDSSDSEGASREGRETAAPGS